MTSGNIKILLIGFGNPARADDGLGPALAEKIESKNIPDVTVETDYQLTIEDSAQAARHDIVIFADASVNCAEPFTFQAVEGKQTDNFSTHLKCSDPCQIEFRTFQRLVHHLREERPRFQEASR